MKKVNYNFVDLVGKAFGRLTVVRENGRDVHGNVLWECVCSCEKTTIVRTRQLTSGNTKSCGCLHAERTRWAKFIDLTGQKFGRLLVIKMNGRNKHNWPFWDCKCDCGNKFKVLGTSLLRGHTKSCGCYRKEFNLLPNNEGALRKLFRIYNRNAEKRNLQFELSKEQIASLVVQNCTYCGQPPEMFINNVFKYNGIDRINNKIGYVFSNCTPCCLKCQRAKMDMSVEEFNLWTLKRYNWLKRTIDEKLIVNTSSF